MNDYIDYMNALSASTSTNEQAQNAYESMINYKDQIVQAKDDYKQQFAIIPELITGASGEFILKGLGSKAISLLSDTAKSAAKAAIKTGLKNAGIDEATAEATANDVLAGNVGNIASRITSSVGDVASGIVGEGEGAINTLRSIGANVLDQVQEGGDIGSALESAASQARSAVSGAVEDIANRGLTAGTEALQTAQGVVRGVAQEGATAVSGLAEQGLAMGQGAVGEATSAISDLVGQAQGAISTATSLAEQGVGVAQGAISGAQSAAGDIVSQGTSLATNFYSKTIDNPSFPTLGQVQERTGFPLEEWSDDWGAANRLEAQSFPSLSSTAPVGPQEVEMVNMASLPSSDIATTGDIATTATAEVGAEAGAEAGASVAEVATDVAATAATEAVGVALDSTGILAPIGALVGLIGGLAGFFGLEKRESLPPPPPPPPLLNPSQSFGT